MIAISSWMIAAISLWDAGPCESGREGCGCIIVVLVEGRTNTPLPTSAFAVAFTASLSSASSAVSPTAITTFQTCSAWAASVRGGSARSAAIRSALLDPCTHVTKAGRAWRSPSWANAGMIRVPISGASCNMRKNTETARLSFMVTSASIVRARTTGSVSSRVSAK